ncbi:NPCBM/NEW2 domain-containing protein [Streptomyces griseoincarnatus]
MRRGAAAALFAALALMLSGASGCAKDINCREQAICGDENDNNQLSTDAAEDSSPADPSGSPEPSPAEEEQATETPPDEDAGGNGTEDVEESPFQEGDKPQQGPRTVYLSDMRPIESSAGEGTTNIAGTTYPSSVWKDFGPGRNLSSVHVVYGLNGEWTTFTADAGPDSDSRSDAVVDFEVYLDDRKLGETHRATLTEPAHIEENVTGGIQLRLVAKYVSGSTSGSYAGQAAWGSARLE